MLPYDRYGLRLRTMATIAKMIGIKYQAGGEIYWRFIRERRYLSSEIIFSRAGRFHCLDADLSYNFPERENMMQNADYGLESFPLGKLTGRTIIATKTATPHTALSLPAVVGATSEIGALVQQIRKEQGMTQIDVAGLAGLGPRFVFDLEHGKETIQMQKALDVLSLLGLEIVIRKKGAA